MNGETFNAEHEITSNNTIVNINGCVETLLESTSDQTALLKRVGTLGGGVRLVACHATRESPVGLTPRWSARVYGESLSVEVSRRLPVERLSADWSNHIMS